MEFEQFAKGGTIKDKVIENSELLKSMKTHTELRQWAIQQGFDNRVAFPKFKLALNEIGLDYDKIKTGIYKTKSEELEKSINYSLTLYSDAKASAGRFAICDKDGNVVWYGRFFETDDADEQSRAELSAAKKAVWFASKVMEYIGQKSLMLNLYVDAEWLTYQEHSGQKGYILTQMARKYNIKLDVSWISGKENPADEWTIASGFKKWSDNDFKSLVEKTKEDAEEIKEKIKEKIKYVPQSTDKTLQFCELIEEMEDVIKVKIRLKYPDIEFSKEIEEWFPKSKTIIYDIENKKISINDYIFKNKLKNIEIRQTIRAFKNYETYKNSYGISVVTKELMTEQERRSKIFFGKKICQIINNYLIVPKWALQKNLEETKESYKTGAYRLSGSINTFLVEKGTEKKPIIVDCNDNEIKIKDAKETEIQKEVQTSEIQIPKEPAELQSIIGIYTEMLNETTDKEKKAEYQSIIKLYREMLNETETFEQGGNIPLPENLTELQKNKVKIILDEYKTQISEKRTQLKGAISTKNNVYNEVLMRCGLFGDTQASHRQLILFESKLECNEATFTAYMKPYVEKIKFIEKEIQNLERNLQIHIESVVKQTEITFMKKGGNIQMKHEKFYSYFHKCFNERYVSLNAKSDIKYQTFEINGLIGHFEYVFDEDPITKAFSFVHIIMEFDEITSLISPIIYFDTQNITFNWSELDIYLKQVKKFKSGGNIEKKLYFCGKIIPI